MKKAIAFILSCSLTAAAVLQGIPANAAGAAEAEIAVQSVSGEFEYKVTDEEMKSCQVTGYTGDEAEIAVPETLDGYTVESIGSGAFSWGTMESVSLPDTVRTIETSAFAGCSALAVLELPDGITSIGGSAFSGCSSLAEFDYPMNWKTAGRSIFSRCSSLTEIRLSLIHI